jgi:hypothetical protein
VILVEETFSPDHIYDGASGKPDKVNIDLVHVADVLRREGLEALYQLYEGRLAEYFSENLLWCYRLGEVITSAVN